MGCCCSVEESEVDYEHMQSIQQNSIKVLLLGTSGSGKTTIVKQLQKINNVYQQNCHSEDNILMFIHNTIVADMKVLCECKHTSVHGNNKHLCKEIVALHPPYIVTTHIAHVVKELYKDIGIQETLKKRHHYQLKICDNIEYFFNKIDEIASNKYVPIFEDSVRITSQTNGYSTTHFVRHIDTFGKYMFEIPDVGGAKSERRKWRHPKLLLDPKLNTIIYVVAISDYNMVLNEGFDDTTHTNIDGNCNRLVDSIFAFRQMLQSMMPHMFENKSIILLFNKYDIFKEKIKTIPITVAFDNIPNDLIPNDTDDVIRFIAVQFSNVFKECGITLQQPLQIVRTIAIETESIKDMFDKINYVNISKQIANKNYLFKSYKEIDGFDAPLIDVPKLTNQHSTPIHHHHLPTLRMQAETHSLPIFTDNIN